MAVRLRLALAGAAIAAVLLSALAVVVALQVRDAAGQEAARLAAADLRSYAVDLHRQPDEGPDVPAAGVLVLVVDPAGAVRRDSMPAALATAARTVRRDGEAVLPGGRFRVVARNVRTADGVWRLWAARDVTASDGLLRGVLVTVLAGTPVAVLLIGLGAWAVTGGALRPVERMRASADRLRAPGATGLLPLRGGPELADLATTLNALIEDLRATAEQERRITADAAHELRTPLAVLAAQVERARRRPSPDDLAAIDASVRRVGRLTDDLLALAHADAGGGGGSATVAALVTEAMAAVDRARVLAPDGIEVDLALPRVLDETATTAIDEPSFGRVLTNLLGNALAAGPASAVQVRLAEQAGALVLVVRDDGPGVPDDFLPFAFDRFSRPEGARSSGSAGAGLGLALVRRLAERAGGSADLRNCDGAGAVATVRLPLGGRAPQV